jgi:hypothetical protein
MAVAGLRGTGDWGTDERPKNFREMILWRNPNGSAPLTALMSKMKTESTDDPEFSWWEEELNPIRLQVAATAATAVTTVAIDSGDAEDLVIGDLLMVEKAAVTTYSYEILQVTAITSATQFAVSRGAAGTTAATIPDNSFLLKIGNAFAEGTASPEASSRNPTKKTNYTQIFKTVYELTGTAAVTRTRTGDPIKNDKKRKMFDHSVAMEQAFMFGHKYETTGSNGKPIRYTGGLMEYLGADYHATDKPTIATISSATTTGEDDFLNATYQVFDYNMDMAGDERIVFAGNGFMNYLNKWARDAGSTRINFDSIVDVYGMKLQRWVIPQGTMYIKTHPLMNVNSRFTNGAFVVDPGCLRYRPMKSRDTTFKDNIQANDEDSRKGQWISEAGVEYNHLRAMRYLAVE